MISIKRCITLLLALLLFFSIFLSVSAMSIYNVNGDIDNTGKDIVDIRDLVRAKKLSAEGLRPYDAVFFVNLKRILLGIDELPQNSSNGGENSNIYLPIVP